MANRGQRRTAAAERQPSLVPGHGRCGGKQSNRHASGTDVQARRFSWPQAGAPAGIRPAAGIRPDGATACGCARAALAQRHRNARPPPAGRYLREPRFLRLEETAVLGQPVAMATMERALLDAVDQPRYATGIGESAGGELARATDAARVRGAPIRSTTSNARGPTRSSGAVGMIRGPKGATPPPASPPAARPSARHGRVSPATRWRSSRTSAAPGPPPAAWDRPRGPPRRRPGSWAP